MKTIDVTVEFIYQRLRPLVTKDSSLTDLRIIAEVVHKDFLVTHPDGKIHIGHSSTDTIILTRWRWRGRARKADRALVKHIEQLGKPLSTAPAGETENEARVRAIKDMLTRCKTSDDAGLRYLTPGTGYDDTWNLQRWLEAQLADAERDVKFERGDY